MTTPALALAGVRKVHRSGFFMRSFLALEGLDLTVPPGEVFGFIGPNGAGKTTAIKLIVGLNRPTAGEIRIFGRPHTELAVRARIGYLPERPYFYDYLKVEEFLHFFGQLYDIPRARRTTRVGELLELVGLTHCRTRALKDLSKGMIQRMGLAQALLNDPDLVILDEPMTGLDPMGRRQVRDVIATLGEQGKTVFFSSHVLSDVELVCDRIAILARGRVRAQGTVEGLLSSQARGVELELGGVGPELAARLRADHPDLRLHGDAVQIRISDEAKAQELVSAALAAGARLLSMHPLRPTLEEMFVEELAEGERQVGGRD